jgi:hypothetical protein
MLIASEDHKQMMRLAKIDDADEFDGDAQKQESKMLSHARQCPSPAVPNRLSLAPLSSRFPIDADEDTTRIQPVQAPVSPPSVCARNTHSNFSNH